MKAKKEKIDARKKQMEEDRKRGLSEDQVAKNDADRKAQDANAAKKAKQAEKEARKR